MEISPLAAKHLPGGIARENSQHARGIFLATIAAKGKKLSPAQKSAGYSPAHALKVDAMQLTWSRASS
jgi:hypothetical protein